LTLLAIPNVSEGSDPARVKTIAAAFAAPGSRLLDVHTDPDHNRSVFTLTGTPGALAAAVVAGARTALELIDLSRHRGLHPHVGVLDVAPIVYLDEADRGRACAEALVLGDRLGEELSLPVLLYGVLAGGRSRAELRRGGPETLARRIAGGELRPDFGPVAVEPRTGVTLLGARPPLVAFNVELAPPATVRQAREIAAAIRESAPGGLPGVRAIGLWLADRGVAQVSMNLEDHRRAGPADVVAAIAAHAEIAEAELVGLAPRAAFAGFPADVRVRHLRLLEEAIAPSP
jgi:glutamate formiminotransferase